MSVDLQLAWYEAPGRIGERVVWVNVHEFSDLVPETVHHEHTGVITGVVETEYDGEMFPMFWVTCSCGERFQSFYEEIAA